MSRAPTGGRGGGRGGAGGRGGGRGSGRGGGRGFQRDEGPPSEVFEAGSIITVAEGDLVCNITHVDKKVPYFNAPIYLKNIQKIGKVDEVFGPITAVKVRSEELGVKSEERREKRREEKRREEKRREEKRREEKRKEKGERREGDEQ